MKPLVAIPFAIGALSFALVFPQSGIAQESPNPQSSQSAATMPGGHEAMRMVPATARLLHALDSKKMQPGYEFQARLDHTVHLDNGPELPAGSLLVGKVAQDDMQVGGTSKLALRFTQAVLKNGQTVPIKATIVMVGKPQSPDNNFSSGYTPTPNTWNAGTLQVDQIGIMSGVDLHSKIASHNSGVLVSTTKDDLKLEDGSRLGLAIAAQPNGQQAMSSMNSGNQ